MTGPYDLAFDDSDNLFAADYGSGNVYQYTPGGVQSTFATGLGSPNGLAFDSAGNLFVSDYGSGNIYQFTPDGTRSTFATGLTGPAFMAFEPAVVPEPSIWAMMIAGAGMLISFRVRAVK